ncbi:MAG: hypothetical protein IKE92_11275 [Clostridiales bacterium]|nr:hypothetical protein [Clostridiales bacterium]
MNVQVNFDSLGGGSNNIEVGSYTVNGSQTIPLPFTPTRVFWYNDDGTYYGSGIEDTVNNIHESYAHIGSNTTNRTSSGVTIGTNQITIEQYSSYFVNDTRYWIAIKD